mmetsp:Transcript_85/g.202  ORF Transcript_85/g.202 Transcript_85/m.202 type:complete len:92 (-) Transcript_85:1617-1892(-)
MEAKSRTMHRISCTVDRGPRISNSNSGICMMLFVIRHTNGLLRACTIINKNETLRVPMPPHVTYAGFEVVDTDVAGMLRRQTLVPASRAYL